MREKEASRLARQEVFDTIVKRVNTGRAEEGKPPIRPSPHQVRFIRRDASGNPVGRPLALQGVPLDGRRNYQVVIDGVPGDELGDEDADNSQPAEEEA